MFSGERNRAMADEVNLEKYKNLLEENPMSISTVSEKEEVMGGICATPNLSVAADIKILSAKQLLIGHNEMVKTVENIKINPSICLMTFDKDWKGVRIYGRAEYHTTGKWSDLAKELFTTKDCTPKGAIVVTADSVEEQS
jgi:predicted pyridoxine 5'-phosphate oxidase superfamily flavin-nucleotide-binding protein